MLNADKYGISFVALALGDHQGPQKIYMCVDNQAGRSKVDIAARRPDFGYACSTAMVQCYHSGR